jgi:hypothetical protein
MSYILPFSAIAGHGDTPGHLPHSVWSTWDEIPSMYQPSAIEVDDIELNSLIQELQTYEDRNRTKPTYEQILAEKVKNGYYDPDMDAYLAAEDSDQIRWADVIGSISLGLQLGAVGFTDSYPGALQGGTAENPNSRSVSIMGTVGEIGALLFRQKLWFAGQQYAAKLESLSE